MNIKCLFGFHDWEECRKSKTVGWSWCFEDIPIVFKADLRFFSPAVDHACLRCGKIREGIEDCKKQIRVRNWKILRARRVAKQRQTTAQEICSMRGVNNYE